MWESEIHKKLGYILHMSIAMEYHFKNLYNQGCQHRFVYKVAEKIQ